VAALLIIGVALNKGKGLKISKTFRPPPKEVPGMDGGSEKNKGNVGGGKVEPWEKPWEKPEGFKIIGLIFFGRPSVVAILDCYLRKNLVSNGGWLDEVHFVVNTKKEEDITYLDGLVEGEALYTKIVIPKLGYNEVWAGGVDKENMYIKIDDDIVGLCLLQSVKVLYGWLTEGECRSTSTRKLSLTLSTLNSSTRNPSTWLPTSSTAPKQDGYITASAPFTPTSLNWNPHRTPAQSPKDRLHGEHQNCQNGKAIL